MRLTLCPELELPRSYIQNQFIHAAAQFSAALGYRYGFCISSRIHHRFYKRVFSKFGYEYWGCENVTINKDGEFDDLEHLLYLTDLHSSVGEPGVSTPIEVETSFHLNLKEQRPLYLCQRLPLEGGLE